MDALLLAHLNGPGQMPRFGVKAIYGNGRNPSPMIWSNALRAAFFAYSSLQRGTNENTNENTTGLLRQYIPKDMDILQVSPTAVAFYTDLLNNRPRKRLQYKTPAEIFIRK